MSDKLRFQPAKITDQIYQNGYVSETEAAHLQSLGVTHLLNLDLPYGSTSTATPDLVVRRQLCGSTSWPAGRTPRPRAN